ncbi:MAG: hypothetical protein ACRDLS_03290 [Solirubrobacteraceae bacterium]
MHVAFNEAQPCPVRGLMRCPACRASRGEPLLAHRGSDLGAEALDRPHDLVVRQRAHAHLKEEALISEQLVLDRERRRVVAGLARGAAVELNERDEPSVRSASCFTVAMKSSYSIVVIDLSVARAVPVATT